MTGATLLAMAQGLNRSMLRIVRLVAGVPEKAGRFWIVERRNAPRLRLNHVVPRRRVSWKDGLSVYSVRSI